MQETLKILIVDDDEVDRLAVRRALKIIETTLEISEAEDSTTAIAMLKGGDFDCAFLDYLLPDKDGLALVRELRANNVMIPLIVLTGQGDEQIAVEIMKAGASDYLSKFRMSSVLLVKTLHNALRIYEAEKEAAIANQQKIELALQKDDFVSRMTHDLRTPLVAANRMLYLFQQGVYGNMSPEMEEVTEVIIRNNENLLEMVNNLLEVYCHESGEKKLNFTIIDMKELLKGILRELVSLAEEKGVMLTLEGKDECASKVKGDRLELHRLLTNLVGNAIKFTDEGFIIVRLTGADVTQSFVIIEIEDTGAGIAQADQITIFERFHQGSHRRSTSGLGLYLSRRIVEAHRGKIEVESEINQGSIFRVYLPIQST